MNGGAGTAAGGNGAASAGDGGSPSVSGNAGVGGAGASGNAGAGGTPVHAEDATFCRAELARAVEHYDGFRNAYDDPTEIPRSAKNGSVRLVGASDWTSGFPAGSFWLLYEFTGEESWRETARRWTAALSGQRTRTDTHDVGFVINNTYGAGHRLTGEAAYVSVVEDAAESLASRFDEDVGATRSWDFGSWSFPVIIDNMMNLELLFHATELGASARFREIAISHALTTLENHFRPDGSSYHVVDYDPNTGGVIRKQTNQGVADESAWARGQAWGLYGFTLCFRETEDARFLERARTIADFYTQSSVMPEDAVPYFDFDAPERSDVNDYRDSSAGAIAASALFELARYVPPEAAERYLEFALRAVRSLSSASYRAALGQNSHFLLQHAVGNYPQNDEIDVAINYGDYYYLEALLRCAALDPLTP